MTRSGMVATLPTCVGAWFQDRSAKGISDRPDVPFKGSIELRLLRCRLGQHRCEGWCRLPYQSAARSAVGLRRNHDCAIEERHMGCAFRRRYLCPPARSHPIRSRSSSFSRTPAPASSPLIAIWSEDHHEMTAPPDPVNLPVGPSRPSSATRTASSAPCSTVSVPA